MSNLPSHPSCRTPSFSTSPCSAVGNSRFVVSTLLVYYCMSLRTARADAGLSLFVSQTGDAETDKRARVQPTRSRSRSRRLPRRVSEREFLPCPLFDETSRRGIETFFAVCRSLFCSAAGTHPMLVDADEVAVVEGISRRLSMCGSCLCCTKKEWRAAIREPRGDSPHTQILRAVKLFLHPSPELVLSRSPIVGV